MAQGEGLLLTCPSPREPEHTGFPGGRLLVGRLGPPGREPLKITARGSWKGA